MIARRCSKTVAFVAILALTIFGALATASAQPADIKAIDKAFQDHYARGNYAAAQIDAQELERLVKARFGADHPYYAVALNQLGRVAHAQRQNSEAEGFYKRALAIRAKTLGASHLDVAWIQAEWQTLAGLDDPRMQRGGDLFRPRRIRVVHRELRHAG